MVGAGGYTPPSVAGGNNGTGGDVILTPGGDFQKLVSVNNQTYWLDDGLLMNFQPFLSNQLMTMGLSRQFLPVPYHSIGYKITDVTIAFHTRIVRPKATIQMGFWEKRKNGLYYQICPHTYFSADILTAYHMPCNYFLQDGATMYLEVVYLDDATLDPTLGDVPPLYGLSAVATLSVGTGNNIVLPNPPVSTGTLIKGHYKDNDEALANNLVKGDLYTLSAESLQGAEWTVTEVF
jgi:hypothetical protein